MKLGAFDYLTKPFDVDELRIIADRAAEHADLRREVEGLRGEVGRKYHIDNIIGNSEGMQAVFETVARVAPLKTTVLITGESGTGKELIAKAIHHQSPRASKAMVTLNCAAIPESLLESELFGHEKGSFTDAVQTKIGQFEHADASTIFLDEIGEMSAALQAKLLRALEEGEVMRVGGDRPVKLDVRVISATNRDLQAEIAAGRFRDDLYYRLNVVALEIPPLRHRGEDLSHLIGHFLKRKAGELGMDERGIGAKALQKMLEYQWPGNVRELENLIERMLVLTPGHGDIGVEQLPPELLGRDASGVHNRDSVLSGNKSLSDAIDDFERDIIGEALSRCQQNQTRAADQLGTTRRILKYRMDKLGISLVEQ
jgi:DNA-binding NtrC family response regulator